jgi:serine/threonine protein kinase
MAGDFARKYRLGERIGAGGMAEIFRATLQGAAGFEREVAIKRIRREYARDARFVGMFIREASLAARLNHPNTVQVFDFDQFPGESDTEQSTYYIAMELVRGWDLAAIEAEARRQGHRLPLDVGLGIVIDVLDGLGHAHSLRNEQNEPLGVVHRDVSPQNVMVSPLGHVKLGDFGIARAIFETFGDPMGLTLALAQPGRPMEGTVAGALHTGAGIKKGKLVYMSPEQVQARPVDHRSDLFSVGILLFELLVGVRPFDAKTDYVTMQNILTGRMRPFPSDVPSPLAAIVRKALEVPLEARYQNAHELRDALRAFADHYALDVGPIVRCQYLRELYGERAESLLRAPATTTTYGAALPPPLPAPRKPRQPGNPLPPLEPAPAAPDSSDVTRPGLRRRDLHAAREPHDPRALVEPRRPLELPERPALPPPRAFVEEYREVRPFAAPSAPPLPHGDGTAMPPPLPPPHHELTSERTWTQTSTPPRGGRPLLRRVARPGWMALAALVLVGGLALPRMLARWRQGRPFRVVVHSWDFQQRWLDARVLRPFARSEGIDVEVVNYYNNPRLLLELLNLGPKAQQRATPPDLVIVPLAYARALVEAGAIAPLDEVVRRAARQRRSIAERRRSPLQSADGLDARLKDEFTPESLTVCRYTTTGGTAFYYLPYKLETRLLAYRVSKVRHVADVWPNYRATLEAALQSLGFGGLPSGYEFEANPWRWDLFDLFVAAYVWRYEQTVGSDAAAPPSAEASSSPRVATEAAGTQGRLGRRSLSAGDYYGTIAELLDTAASLALTPADLSQPSDALADAFAWDAARWALGLYHRSTVDGEALRGGKGASAGTLIDGIARGDIYAAALSQRHFLLLKGDPALGLAPRVKSPGDLADIGVAPLPRGASLQLGPDRQPLRAGEHHSIVDGWVVGIPRGVADPARSWRLARLLTGSAIHADETGTFLTMAVRFDAPPPTEGFARLVYQASVPRDNVSAGFYIPRFTTEEQWVHYQRLLLSAWRQLVVTQGARRQGGRGVIDDGLIHKALARSF